MIEPMLAMPADKITITNWTEWFLERKWDGERRIVQVFQIPESGSTSWTRPRARSGVAGKTMAQVALPAHIVTALVQLFPRGAVVDCELMNGQTSTDVRRKDLRGQERLVIFDILMHGDHSLVAMSNSKRRMILEAAFGVAGKWGPLELSVATYHLDGPDDVARHFKAVTDQGGEGVMLKRKEAPYQPGKRSKDWIKVKKKGSAVGFVIGFQATRGQIMKRGQFAVVRLEDEQGNQTKVKTLDDAALAAFEKEWKDYLDDLPADAGEERRDPQVFHPAIGRKLRFEYQEFTPKGGYRHPKWDRWEDE